MDTLRTGQILTVLPPYMRIKIGKIQNLRKMSKSNERWCRILLEKKEHFPPPVTVFFFLGKKIFFGFSEKFSKFFFNEIDCKKFSNFFYNEVSSKKFFNSLKMTTKNFRNFFQ